MTHTAPVPIEPGSWIERTAHSSPDRTAFTF